MPVKGERSSQPGIVRQLLSVLLLPFNAIVVVPALMLRSWSEVDTRWPFDYPLLALPQVPGALLAIAGLVLVARTVRLFATVGEGTLAPWDPTHKLVVAGPYRRVRNPMISGVAMTLLGVATTTGSTYVAAWFAFFVALNHVYFLLVEEPGLVRRFGESYEEYRRQVPRWIPRRRSARPL